MRTWEAKVGAAIAVAAVVFVGAGHRVRGAPAPAAGDPTDASWLPRPGRMVVRTAEQYLGARYQWGGDTPGEGFDCSGFVQHVYALNGIPLPRVSRAQSRTGRRVRPELSELRAGDLLFFGGAPGAVDHVAIYRGDSTMIHSSSAGGYVRTDRLDARSGGWYARRLIAARRVTALDDD